MTTDEYRVCVASAPPVVRIHDGQLVIEVICGHMTIVASAGDGSWFFSQVVEKLVDPALRNAHIARELMRHPISPND